MISNTETSLLPIGATLLQSGKAAPSVRCFAEPPLAGKPRSADPGQEVIH